MKRKNVKALLAGSLVACATLTAMTASAQDAKGQKTKDGFTRLPSGLEYKTIVHGNGKRKPVIGDHVEINIRINSGDSVMFDSRKMNNDKPVPLPIAAFKYNGDVMEGFTHMVAGDSTVFRVSIDSIRKTGAQMPPWVTAPVVEYRVTLVSVRSDEEEKKFQAEKTEKQKNIDDKLLAEYFTNNSIKPEKTPSGLYYTITKPGTGDNAKSGQTLSVNYTGMFMDGRKFDSNTDSAFHHVQPFEVEVGMGRVIKGWDEGLLLLKKGTKARLYIPSGLAYGGMDRQGIPANSILIFDVEVVNIMTPEEKKKEAEERQRKVSEAAAKQVEIDDKILQDYFAKNKIKAEKTASGLYYVMTTKGLGNNARAGNKVTVNYTGKLLDGTVFDSNSDPAKGHVAPFSFNLGTGQVIRGWDEGIQLFKLGGRGTLYIPSTLAYGPQGNNGIPPNAPLIFDIEVTGIDKK